MGVPQYFYWLIKQHGNVILQDINPDECDYLFLDFNCAIHPAVKSNDFTTYEQLYNAVISYLLDILKAVKPKKLLYIAIDGTAPLSKMKQQRYRRYKTVYDKIEKDKIERKYNKVEKKGKFDFNMISPGTEFMNNLIEKLTEFIDTKLKKQLNGIRIIFDDANNPGEGEHKIMRYIRNNDIDNIIIYGLDSDLIFLSLLQCKKNLKLIREKIFFDNGKKDKKKTSSTSSIYPTNEKEKEKEDDNKNDVVYNYLDIVALKDIILKEFDCILDYVALSFILGNDFLPHLPSLNIKEGGFDRAIVGYKEVRKKLGEKLLITNLDVKNSNRTKYIKPLYHFNTLFLRELFKYILQYEDEDLEYAKDNSLQRQSKFRAYGNGIEKELADWEYIENKTVDVLMLGQEGWVERYYNYYLGDNDTDIVFNMVREYLTGLQWILNYYTNDYTNWSWVYQFRASPTAQSIVNFLDKIKNKNFFEKIVFLNDKPISCIEQLLIILPPQSSELIDPQFRKIMTSSESSLSWMYPTKFNVDLQNHRYRYEAYPILPDINLEEVRRLYTLFV